MLRKRFRPLSGNLLSLLSSQAHSVNRWKTCFRPLSGNLLSLLSIWKKVFEKPLQSFSSPIGESTFSTRGRNVSAPFLWFSSPIGESTFSTCFCHRYGIEFRVFVPYRGIYFLYCVGLMKKIAGCCFRPLSGNLLSLLR